MQIVNIEKLIGLLKTPLKSITSPKNFPDFLSIAG